MRSCDSGWVSAIWEISGVDLTVNSSVTSGNFFSHAALMSGVRSTPRPKILIGPL